MLVNLLLDADGESWGGKIKTPSLNSISSDTPVHPCTRSLSGGGRGPLPLLKLERTAIDAEARVHLVRVIGP